MIRIIKRGILLKYRNSSRELQHNVKRCVATQISKSDVLFPERVDFPSRHIGPRDQDLVTMLDLLGYKVRILYISLCEKIKTRES